MKLQWEPFYISAILFGLFLQFPSQALAQSYEIKNLALEDVKGTDKKKGIIDATMDATPQEIYTVITDYEHFQDFMPNIKDITVLRRSKEKVEYKIEIDMPFPISNITYENRVYLFPDELRTQHELVEGSSEDVKSFYGRWDLNAKNKKQTSVQYEVFFQTKTRYPRFIEGKATTSSMKKVIKAVYEQVLARRDHPR